MLDTQNECSSSAEARAKRLKRLRNLANLTRKELAAKYHININTLKGWEVARHGGLTEKGAEKIISILAQEGVNGTLNWLLYGKGKGPFVFDKGATDTDEEKRMSDELTLFRLHYPDSIDFLVPDDSALPFYEAGDYVAGIKRYDKQITACLQKFCLVQIKNGPLLLRQLFPSDQTGFYNLSSSTQALNNVEITFAAIIIWHRRRHWI